MSGQRATNGTRVPISLRIHPTELERIDKAAERLKLTRTDYMVRAALRQPLGDENTEGKLEEVEERLGRLERLADLGSFG